MKCFEQSPGISFYEDEDDKARPQLSHQDTIASIREMMLAEYAASQVQVPFSPRVKVPQ